MAEVKKANSSVAKQLKELSDKVQSMEGLVQKMGITSSEPVRAAVLPMPPYLREEFEEDRSFPVVVGDPRMAVRRQEKPLMSPGTVQSFEMFAYGAVFGLMVCAAIVLKTARRYS